MKRIILSIFIIIPAIQVFIFSSASELLSQVAQPYPKISTSSDKPMYMISYDHGGIILWGKDHFIHHLETAREWLDKYPGFKIGLDNEAYFYDFLKAQDSSLLTKIRDYLKIYRGRFGIGTCSYGQPLSQFINDESNIRQIGYALETEREIFGYTPTVYLMSEHAMHSQIPQIIKGFGFSGAIMRTHYMNFGYNPTYDSPIGWWIGMDGSRIPTIPTYKGEGNSFGSDTEDNNILCCYPSESCNIPLEAFREKFSGIDPLIATRADDAGLRHEELVREYEGKKGFRWLLADEIFRNFPPPVDEYKTRPDDFHVRMPWGYCGNEIWQRSREAEIRVLTAERIAALEVMMNGENLEIPLRRAWKNLLVGQHHDIQICGLVNEARKFLGASLSASDSVMNSSLRFFASQMEGGSLAQITLFNPLSISRKEWLKVPVEIPGEIKYIRIRFGEKPVRYEILQSEYDKQKKITKIDLSIFAEMPPLAVQSLSIEKGKGETDLPERILFDNQKLIITTPYWIIRLDTAGGLAGIQNRETGRQMLGKTSYPFLAGVIGGEEEVSRGRWEINSIVLRNNLLIISESGLTGSLPYSVEMKLTGDSPLISFKVSIKFNGEKIGKSLLSKDENEPEFFHETKLRFKIFPSLGIGTTGIRDLPFTLASTDSKYIEGNYWTCIADGHSGMAILNRGEMALVRETDGSISIPLAFSAFKVLIPVSLHGDFNYEFALYPFDGKWEDAGIHSNALRYSFPVVAMQTAAGNSRSGHEVALFDLHEQNVIMTALYTDKGNPFIRFYDNTSNSGTLSLTTPLSGVDLIETDLWGHRTGTCSGEINFTPWKIRTFMIPNIIK